MQDPATKFQETPTPNTALEVRNDLISLSQNLLNSWLLVPIGINLLSGPVTI